MSEPDRDTRDAKADKLRSLGIGKPAGRPYKLGKAKRYSGVNTVSMRDAVLLIVDFVEKKLKVEVPEEWAREIIKDREGDTFKWITVIPIPNRTVPSKTGDRKQLYQVVHDFLEEDALRAYKLNPPGVRLDPTTIKRPGSWEIK